VFVLGEAFDLPYDIAEIIGSSTANCRQMHRRAGQRLAIWTVTGGENLLRLA
jgi:hypothetical protein